MLYCCIARLQPVAGLIYSVLLKPNYITLAGSKPNSITLSDSNQLRISSEPASVMEFGFYLHLMLMLLWLSYSQWWTACTVSWGSEERKPRVQLLQWTTLNFHWEFCITAVGLLNGGLKSHHVRKFRVCRLTKRQYFQ